MKTTRDRSLLCWNAVLLKVPKSCTVGFWASMKRVKEIDVKLQQRINLFFCYKLGWNHVDARAALQAVFGDQTLHPTKTRKWYWSFAAGRTSLVDQDRAHRHKSGRTPANVQAVRTLLDADKSMTFAGLMAHTRLKQTTVHRIVKKDLMLKLRCAKLLPAFLTPRHIVERFNHCAQMLQSVRNRPSFLKKIVTMDEAWCYQYDPETKRQASQWLAAGEPCPSHPRRSISIKKIMLVAFFDYRGMVHFEFIRGGTVDTATFIQILGRFKEALRLKRPHLTHLLHMDNAPAHGSRDTKLHLLLTGQRTLANPALSPDLSPSDFWLFGKLKKPLRGHRFPSLDALQTAVANQIGLITAAEYRDAILRQWPMRWARCVHANGDYFEGLE